jgi:hypothetical protein
MEETQPTGGIEVGRPGASARAEFERRRRLDAARRRRRFGRFLAPLVALLAGVRPSTARWGVGGRAEERVGQLLTEAVGRRGIVLHDRAIPRGRANLDHIAVVPSGVWVVDTKRYRGRVRRGRPPGRLFGRRTLLVNGHDRGRLVTGALRQRALVQSAAGAEVPVRAVLCFAGAEWGPRARPFVLRGVLVTWPAALASSLRAAGPLDGEARAAFAARLARAFPPYAPSGTSHRPTGASPGR